MSKSILSFIVAVLLATSVPVAAQSPLPSSGVTVDYVGAGFSGYARAEVFASKGYAHLGGNLWRVVRDSDDVFYRASDGLLVVGFTNHPQRSGHRGSYVGVAGDCWDAFSTGLTGATVTADRNGVVLYRASDGKRIRITSTALLVASGCDTSDTGYYVPGRLLSPSELPPGAVVIG